MAKILLFLSILLTQGFSAEFATPPQDELTFTLSNSTHTLTFKQVDMAHLTEPEINNYINHFTSWSNLRAQFGPLNALALKIISWVSSNQTMYNRIKNEMDKATTLAPANFKIGYYWFIFDKAHSDQFVGTVGIFLYPYTVPQGTPRSHYYNLSLSLVSDYQKQGIATNLSRLFIKQIQSIPDLQESKLLLRMRIDNEPGQKLVNKFEFIKPLGHKWVAMDFSHFQSEIHTNFFEIDLSKPLE